MFDDKQYTEQELINIVTKNPILIKYIKNPSENIQLEAVKKCGYSIEYIENPSENVIKYLFDNLKGE